MFSVTYDKHIHTRNPDNCAICFKNCRERCDTCRRIKFFYRSIWSFLHFCNVYLLSSYELYMFQMLKKGVKHQGKEKKKKKKKLERRKKSA